MNTITISKVTELAQKNLIEGKEILGAYNEGTPLRVLARKLFNDGRKIKLMKETIDIIIDSINKVNDNGYYIENGRIYIIGSRYSYFNIVPMR